MILVARGSTIDATKPSLTFYGVEDGLLVDPFVVEYQVFDVSTDAKTLEPVQVFPAVEGTRASVDLVDDRAGVGRYAATWTVPETEPAGEHEIRWFHKATSTSAEVEAVERFEVLDGLPSLLRGPTYASLKSIRNAYEAACGISDVRLLNVLHRVGSFIERATRRSFLPTFKTVVLDGGGTSTLFLDAPVVAVDALIVDGVVVDAEDWIVYGRDPRIVWSSVGPSASIVPGWGWSWYQRRFPWGRQSVSVSGVFGHVEPNALAPWGTVPLEIEHVARLLVARDLTASANAAAGVVYSGPISSERTRDQSVSYETSRAAAWSSGWTGDPEIDGILARWQAPPFVGAT